MKEKIILALQEVFDPEIPVNIFDLGLIYDIDIDIDNNVNIKMTLTTPNCPEAERLPNEIHNKVNEVSGVKSANVEVVFDPPWTQDRMSEEAKLELGLL